MARAGRPRGFDRAAAVDSAMLLFWERGYERASLDALRRAMGGGQALSSASFYAAFGSKEALYREALARYHALHGGMLDMLRDRALAPRARLERALRASVAVQADASHPLGCMLTLSAPFDAQAGGGAWAEAAHGRGVTRAALRDCLQAGVEAGALTPDADLQGLTALFDAFLLGVSIQVRDGVPPAAIEASVGCALAAWDACAIQPCAIRP